MKKKKRSKKKKIDKTADWKNPGACFKCNADNAGIKPFMDKYFCSGCYDKIRSNVLKILTGGDNEDQGKIFSQ